MNDLNSPHQEIPSKDKIDLMKKLCVLDEKERNLEASYLASSRPKVFGKYTIQWDGLLSFLFNIFDHLLWMIFSSDVKKIKNESIIIKTADQKKSEQSDFLLNTKKYTDYSKIKQDKTKSD